MMRKNESISKGSVRKKIYIYILAFIIPVIIMGCTYAALKIYPFGGKSLLIKDLDAQYVSFFANFRDILAGHGSVFYSFSKNLGGNMLELFAYYLSSPLNIVLLLFPKAAITEAILVMTLLKIGLCGLTFAIYINISFKKNDFSVLIFSTCYALMAYNIVYQQNLMWLDVIFWFPLVMAGIDKIIDNNEFLLYIISLTMAILSNFYIAYMVCIFSLLYFLYKLFLSSYFNAASCKAKAAVSRSLLWGGASLTAGGLSAFLLLPSLEALRHGKASFNTSILMPKADFRFYDIVSKIYLGSFNWNQVISGLPNIFCGTLIIVLIILYFLNKNIKFTEKVYTGVFIFILFLSFYISTINLVWHLFNYPNSFPYRYSFVFSFILIAAAYKSFICLDRISPRKVIAIVLLFTGISLLVNKLNYKYLPSSMIYITVLMLLLYCCILYFLKRSSSARIKGIFLAVCFILVCCEMGLNSFFTLKQFDYLDRQPIVSFVNSVEPEIKSLSEKDKSFYRLEKTFQYTFNDSMLLNYNGITHFSSTADINILKFLQQIGFRSNGIWASFDKGSTIMTDSVLSMKYILSGDVYSNYYKKVNDFGGNKTAYENPYALPVGFMVNSDIQKVNINDENPFDLQNQIMQSMLHDKGTDYFYRMPVKEIRLQNVTAEKSGNATVYTKNNPHQEGDIEFILTAPDNYPVYAFFPSDNFGNVNLYINDKPSGAFFNVYNYDVMSLGSFKKGSEISLKMRLTTDKTSIKDDLFYYLNMNNFKSAYDELSKNVFDVSNFNSTHFSGTVHVTGDKTVLYTSIPYDDGWKVKINGKPAEKIRLLNTLVGVRVPEGKSSIEMSYTPPGFTAGLIISFISIILLAAFIIAGRKIKI